MVKEVLDRLQVGPEALSPPWGGRGARPGAVLLSRRMNVWYDRWWTGSGMATPDLRRRRSGSRQLAGKAQGYGYLDAQSALGHWVQIENGKISRYQCVVPSTWNCSPATRKARWAPTRPPWWTTTRWCARSNLEILRTIHSFDPCMACGVHVLDMDGNRITEIRVNDRPTHAGFGRPTPTPTGDYRWVYLWGWPLRAMHWLAALAIVVLAATGFFIGRPYFVVSGDTADHFVMGWMRFVHFTAASVLVATVIVRVYWLFAGNKFERWVALSMRRDWVNMVRQVKYYLIHPEKAPHYLGHNPLQQLSYTGIYLLRRSGDRDRLRDVRPIKPRRPVLHRVRLAGPALRGLQVVRFVHHVVTWLFLAFIPIHVYLATRSDIMERGGAISSIITGGKFVPAGSFVDE